MGQEHQIIVDGVHYVEKSIREDLKYIENEEMVRILGVIRFVARRRTKVGRKYMTVIHPDSKNRRSSFLCFLLPVM